MKPKLGVVYHYKDEDGVAAAVRKEYNGPLVIARDLMVINVGEAVTLEGKSFPASTSASDKSGH